MLTFYLNLIDTSSEKIRFEEVYHTYKKQMGYLAKSMLNNQQDAEDVVHDVFCKVASSHLSIITNAENENDIRNYLLKSVKNACISMQRKKKVRTEFEHQKASERFELSDNEFLDTVCRDFEYSAFLKALTSLDEKYREVLYYHLVLDLSVKATAKMVNRTPNTVRQQITRGKIILISQLSERE